MTDGSAKLPPIVLVHGYTACHLVERDSGSRRYLQLFGLFGVTIPALQLPMQWEKDEATGKLRQKTDELVPGEIIYDPVGPLSGLIGQRIIGNLVDDLRAKYGKETTVHGRLDSTTDRARYDPEKQRLFFFTYDWRRDNNESSERLRNFLSDLKETHELPQVVAHSNGGLLAYVALNEADEELAK